MNNFIKEHEYLICIDSDGTIMDTMKAKHMYGLGPTLIKIFNITHHSREILTKWNDINLYSKTRGIDCFQELKEMIPFFEKCDYKFEGSDEYLKWINETNNRSNESIEKQISKTNSPFFKKVLSWSIESNNLISKLPPSQYFQSVKEKLKTLSKNAI